MPTVYEVLSGKASAGKPKANKKAAAATVRPRERPRRREFRPAGGADGRISFSAPGVLRVRARAPKLPTRPRGEVSPASKYLSFLRGRSTLGRSERRPEPAPIAGRAPSRSHPARSTATATDDLVHPALEPSEP